MDILPIANRFQRALSITVLAVSSVVLLGWVFQNPTLIQIHPSFVPMQFNTALCFAISATGVLLGFSGRSTLSVVFGLTVMVISFLTILQYMLGVNFNIDQLFIGFYISTLTPFPGRMGINTALCFFIIGLSIVLIVKNSPINILKLLAPLVVGLSWLALSGYILGIDTAYVWGDWSGMAIHTAVLFILLGCSLTFWGASTLPKDSIFRRYWEIITVFIALVIFLFALAQSLTEWQHKNIKKQVNAQLDTFVTLYETELHSQIDAMNRMVTNWSKNNSMSYEIWRIEASSYLFHLSDLKSVAVINQDLTVKWRYQKLPDSLLDKTLYQLPAVITMLKQSQLEQSIKLSSVFNLPFTDDHFVAVSLPITESNFSGYLIGIIDIEDLLEQLTFYTGFYNDFSIEITSPDTQSSGKITAGSRQHSVEYSTPQQAQIYNSFWDITLSPSRAKVANYSSALPIMIFGSSLLGSALIFLLLILWRRSREKSLSLENEIKHHKETRKQLIHQETRHRATLKTMADAVVLADTNGDIVSFNTAAVTIFGYSEQEIIGQNVRILMSDPHRSQHDSYLNNFKGGAKPKIIGIGREVTALKKSGEQFPIYLAIADMKLDGQFYFSAVIRDISEQKHHESELARYTLDLAKNNTDLERSNRELNDFAYVASHDLKAPLRGVLQIVNWIEEDLDGTLSEQVQDYFSLMKNRIGRLEKLLDDLLSYSRAGRNHGDFTEVDLAKMAADLFELLDPPKDVKLIIDEPLPVFNTLVTPLEIIIRNLINNAIKHHNKPDGVITISAKKIDAGYSISITDNGPGIAPRFHDKVFGIFQTLRPRDELEASGMGLAVVKKLVETYQGNISIISDGESGTEMSFTWPNETKLRKILDE